MLISVFNKCHSILKLIYYFLASIRRSAGEVDNSFRSSILTFLLPPSARQPQKKSDLIDAGYNMLDLTCLRHLVVTIRGLYLHI